MLKLLLIAFGIVHPENTLHLLFISTLETAVVIERVLIFMLMVPVWHLASNVLR